MLGHAQASTLIGSWNGGGQGLWSSGFAYWTDWGPATSAGAHCTEDPAIEHQSTGLSTMISRTFPNDESAIHKVKPVPPKLSDRPFKNSTQSADPTQGPRRFEHERRAWQLDGATGLGELPPCCDANMVLFFANKERSLV